MFLLFVSYWIVASYFYSESKTKPMVKVLQLSVEVGKCQLPGLVTNQYDEYLLTVSLTHELSACTSLKEPQQGVVDFGTKLFIRLDKLNTPNIPQCSICLTGVTPGRTKVEVARTTISSKTEGSHRVPLETDGRLGEGAWVDLEFSCGMVEVKESKSIINQSNSFKSNNSQKQSSLPPQGDLGLRTAGNFGSTAVLAHIDSRESLNSSRGTAKVSKQNMEKIASSEDLETSVATSKPYLNNLDKTGKCEQTTTMLSMQLKIDQLQQSLSQLAIKLREVTEQLEVTAQTLRVEQSKTAKLELERQELWQLLTLEELKTKIANDYANKINKIYEQLSRGDQEAFQLIQEKDEIIMLNQQLEVELHQKTELIEQLRNQICGLRDKISSLQIKHIHTLSTESSSIKKIQNLPSKDLEKVKSQKKLNERKASGWNKKQEETKQTNNTRDTLNKGKEKEVDRRRSRKQTEVKPAPNRNARDSKNVKNELAASPKIPKGKAVKGGKPTLETSKKSNTESMVEHTNNLMINSRSLQAESSSKIQKA